MAKRLQPQQGKGEGGMEAPAMIFGEGRFSAAANRQVVPFIISPGTASNDELLVMKVIFCKTWKLSPIAILTKTLGNLHNKGHTRNAEVIAVSQTGEISLPPQKDKRTRNKTYLSFVASVWGQQPSLPSVTWENSHIL